MVCDGFDRFITDDFQGKTQNQPPYYRCGDSAHDMRRADTAFPRSEKPVRRALRRQNQDIQHPYTKHGKSGRSQLQISLHIATPNRGGMKIKYGELFAIISKQWANVNDIKQLCGNGRDQARQIRTEIELDLEKNGKKLLSGKEKKVPMSKVIDYLNIDIDYIAKMTMLEKRINNEREI